MDKNEAITYLRAFMEATGLTNDDLVKPKEPTVNDLCPRKRWVPQNTSLYWRVIGDEAYSRRWDGDTVDLGCLAQGCVFPTEEAAREHIANMKAWVELRERSCEYVSYYRHPVTVNGWCLPGVRFESENARDLAVEAVGGQARLEKLSKWLHNK